MPPAHRPASIPATAQVAFTLAALLAGAGAVATPDASAPVAEGPAPALRLEPCRVPGVDAGVQCGTHWVYEDRASRTGRRVPLAVVVLPARAATPAPDPVVVLSGGPGHPTTHDAGFYWRSWLRDERAVVLVDQRGTSDGLRLDCALPGSDDDPAGYLQTPFSPAAFRACRRVLAGVADLRQYTSAPTVDDIDEVREALGYARVNLYGASWGTRAALIYLRRHPEVVRSAIMLGVAPTSLRNPLPHARSAQDALDLLFDACGRQPACRAAVPAPREALRSVLGRLERAPATVTIRHPGTGERLTLRLTWQQFAEALRVMTYDPAYAARVPLLLQTAADGDLSAFASLALESNRRLRQSIRFGVLMSIVCNEDASRIREDEIPAATAGTYLRDSRVREQLAACAEWPRADVPADYGAPVRSDVPALLISGTADPVTPPRFGAEAARHLPRSLHIVAPGAHVPGGPCIDAIGRAFLRAASAAGVDTSCVGDIAAAPEFEVRS